jgi:hypothetical protein
MSQIYKQTSGGSTPIPPTVPEVFVTDIGSAIPAANSLNVNGVDSTVSNDNGIYTQADPNLSANLEIVLSNRIVVTATTSDGAGQTQTVNLFTPVDGKTISFSMLVTGFDGAPNNLGIGGELIGIARRVGGTLTVIGTNDTFKEADAAILAADWDVIDTASPVLQAQFVGVAGRTITWKALFEYIQT